MSFKKIQIIDPKTISNPDTGHIYLGQDSIGLWEKDEFGNIWYINSGSTYITFMTGSTSSGTSGENGTSGSSGQDGTFLGSSGSSGKSGNNGTSGSSGKDGLDASGSSGKNGSSGSSGLGTSGSSGISGSSGNGSSGTAGSSGNGSSGTAGSSGLDGGYGGASRLWIFAENVNPTNGAFYANSSYGYDLSLIDIIKINEKDFNGQILDGWLDSWNRGILKIEDRLNLANYGIYLLNGNIIKSLGVYTITGYIIYSGQGLLVPGKEYLISYIPSGEVALDSIRIPNLELFTKGNSAWLDTYYYDLDTSEIGLLGTYYGIPKLYARIKDFNTEILQYHPKIWLFRWSKSNYWGKYWRDKSVRWRHPLETKLNFNSGSTLSTIKNEWDCPLISNGTQEIDIVFSDWIYTGITSGSTTMDQWEMYKKSKSIKMLVSQTGQTISCNFGLAVCIDNPLYVANLSVRPKKLWGTISTFRIGASTYLVGNNKIYFRYFLKILKI